MAETFIVCAIVGTVIVLAGRSLYRTVAGKNDSCGCGIKSCSTSGCCRQPLEIDDPEKK